MQQDILKLLESRLSEALRGVDEKTASEIRNIWATINPSPACPTVADVMKKINRICHHGLSARGEKGRDVVVCTLLEFRKFLTKKFMDQIMEVVIRQFPEDQYLALAKNTKGVYQRSQAPPNKFSDRAFDIELAAISVGSANLSRRAVENIRTALDELRIQRDAGIPTTWERVKKFMVHWLAVPVIRWVFKILAAIIVAFILYVFGIQG